MVKTLADPFHLPKISIVVASYNSESRSYLRRCLESITNQEYSGEVELIVVDGGSTDESVAVSLSYGARIIHNPNVTELGFAGGKNLGIIHSTGEFVAIVDADNILMSSHYLTKMIQPFLEDNEISMTVPMPYIPLLPEECTDLCRYFCLMEKALWESLINSGTSRGSWVKFLPSEIVVSNGAIIRRSILKKIGGWDYDTEVGFRLIENGFGAFGIVSSAERFHIEMLNFGDVWRKYKRRILNQIEEKKQKKVSQSKIDEEIRNPLLLLKKELLLPFKNLPQGYKKYYTIALTIFFIKLLLGLDYIVLSHKLIAKNARMIVQNE